MQLCARASMEMGELDVHQSWIQFAMHSTHPHGFPLIPNSSDRCSWVSIDFSWFVMDIH